MIFDKTTARVMLALSIAFFLFAAHVNGGTSTDPYESLSIVWQYKLSTYSSITCLALSAFSHVAHIINKNVIKN